MIRALVLGGTRYFGKIPVEKLLKRGAKVTLLTRGNHLVHFTPEVEHLIADRNSESSTRDVIGSRSWDVVFDQSCYHPSGALASIRSFSGRCGHLVFTSSQAVYHQSGELHEKHFDALCYPSSGPIKEELSYAEAKRSSEAIYFQSKKMPITALRFPAVIGCDDYLRRIHFYVSAALQGAEIFVPDPNRRFTLISPTEAAATLEHTLKTGPIGAVNLCSHGSIAMSELIQQIESATDRKINICTSLNHSNQLTPLDRDQTQILNTQKASSYQFPLMNLSDWLLPLIQKIAAIELQGDPR